MAHGRLGVGIHGCKEVYQAYAKKVLQEHPEYWGKYGNRIKNTVIYRKDNNKVVEVISYKKFREIVDKYFERARYYIIEGYELNLGNDLGVIAARRVERNLSNKSIDYQATQKQPIDPVTGKRVKIVYFTNEDWCRIGWKKSGKVRNMVFYTFLPTPHDGAGNGFKKEFSRALTKNTLLKYRYQYFPYIQDVD